MKIILTSIDARLTAAWESAAKGLADVSVVHGSILDVDCDAVVSPANSFGFMDGGIDMVYTRKFGIGVQEDLQRVIRDDFHGELLVGQAAIVATGYDSIPYLVSAPTMRIPMILTDTVNPYLAARAVLLEIAHGPIRCEQYAGEPARDHIKSVAFPGLGTGVGCVPPETCALQVRQAIGEFIVGRRFPETWAEAGARHQKLFGAGQRDLQR